MNVVPVLGVLLAVVVAETSTPLNGIVVGLGIAVMCLLALTPSALVQRHKGRPLKELLDIEWTAFGLVGPTLFGLAMLGGLVSLISAIIWLWRLMT